MQLIQNAAVKLVTGKNKFDHLNDDYKKLHWLTIKKRIIFKIALLSFKSINGCAPQYLQDMFQYSHHGYLPKLIVPSNTLKVGHHAFSTAGPKIFNLLPYDVKSSPCVNSFKKKLKTHLFAISDTELQPLWV